MRYYFWFRGAGRKGILIINKLTDNMGSLKKINPPPPKFYQQMVEYVQVLAEPKLNSCQNQFLHNEWLISFCTIHFSCKNFKLCWNLRWHKIEIYPLISWKELTIKTIKKITSIEYVKFSRKEAKMFFVTKWLLSNVLFVSVESKKHN